MSGRVGQRLAKIIGLGYDTTLMDNQRSDGNFAAIEGFSRQIQGDTHHGVVLGFGSVRPAANHASPTLHHRTTSDQAQDNDPHGLRQGRSRDF